MGKILVTAGEASGDQHAARVIKYIKKLKPRVKVSGMGSEKLKEAGAEILLDPTTMNSIGLQEAVSNFSVHLEHYRVLKDYISKERPDVMFLVDYSGFNMVMARLGAKLDIPVVNYFPPSAWVWGRWRARWMARTEATIAAVFPMEIDVYRRAGAEVEFVGHPLLDVINRKQEQDVFSRLEISPEKKTIALLPGSRRAEINRLLPSMLEAAVHLKNKNQELQILLPLAENIPEEAVLPLVTDSNVVLKVVRGLTQEALQAADFAIIASGTASLEAAILKTPMLIIYKTSTLTYRLGKRLLNVDFIGLPNLISSREIVPELIQKEVSPAQIFKTVDSYLQKPYLLKNMRHDLEQIARMLGKKGAVERTAHLVLKKGAITGENQGYKD